MGDSLQVLGACKAMSEKCESVCLAIRRVENPRKIVAIIGCEPGPGSDRRAQQTGADQKADPAGIASRTADLNNNLERGSGCGLR